MQEKNKINKKMAKIKAADVAKLRKMTGAGMMDCKKALSETNGNFEEAITFLRKKGQKLAEKRADREASEGVVIAKTSKDKKTGGILVLNCETDFVAKNDDFVKFADEILELAITKKVNSLEELKTLKFKNTTVSEELVNQVGVIGEKINLSFFYLLEDKEVVTYTHNGNKLASMVSFNKENVDKEVGKNVAMQIAAMKPVALDKNGVSKEIADKELEIGKALAIKEGKPEKLAERISFGRLNKFFKEKTLLNQAFVKNNKISIKEYLKESSKDLTATNFKYYSL